MMQKNISVLLFLYILLRETFLKIDVTHADPCPVSACFPAAELNFGLALLLAKLVREPHVHDMDSFGSGQSTEAALCTLYLCVLL